MNRPSRPAKKSSRTEAEPSLELVELQAQKAADFLKTMANKHRLMVLCALLEGEHSAGQLAERLGATQPNTSQHLFKLKAEGLVETRRAAQTIFYRLASTDIKPIIEHLHRLFCER